MPHFEPARINRMEAQIRQVVAGMIDEIADRGEVDIAWDFGRIYPVRIPNLPLVRDVPDRPA